MGTFAQAIWWLLLFVDNDLTSMKFREDFHQTIRLWTGWFWRESFESLLLSSFDRPLLWAECKLLARLSNDRIYCWWKWPACWGVCTDSPSLVFLATQLDYWVLPNWKIGVNKNLEVIFILEQELYQPSSPADSSYFIENQAPSRQILRGKNNGK